MKNNAVTFSWPHCMFVTSLRGGGMKTKAHSTECKQDAIHFLHACVQLLLYSFFSIDIYLLKMLLRRHWDWLGLCRSFFSSKLNKISNTTTLYCSQSCVLFSVLPPRLAPPFFFSHCVLDRIVYVAWVWLCASRFLTSMAGTCVDHYLIKVLQYIQPGSVLGLRYPAVTSSAVFAPCFVVCCTCERAV